MKEIEDKKMSWFKKHADTATVLSSIVLCICWINGKMSDLDKKVSQIERDIAIVKTVMVMKNIMPTELACAEEK